MSLVRWTIRGALWLGFVASGMLLVLTALLRSDDLARVVQVGVWYGMGVTPLVFLLVTFDLRGNEVRAFGAVVRVCPKWLRRLSETSLASSTAVILLTIIIGKVHGGEIPISAKSVSIAGFGLAWFSGLLAYSVSAERAASLPLHEKRRMGLRPRNPPRSHEKTNAR